MPSKTTKVALNWNNQVALARLTPQPACPGPKFADRVYSPDGTASDVGAAYLELKYSISTEAQYIAICAALGLSDTLINRVASRRITLQAPTNYRTFAIYNGTVSLPEKKWSLGFHHDVVFIVTGLQYLRMAS